jgi:hypothetical protein
MARSTDTRLLHYRKAMVYKTPGSLQSLLTRALRALDSPAARQEPMDATGGSLRFINHAVTSQGMLCGNMLSFSKGAAQVLMATAASKASDAEASSYPLEALRAPKIGGHPAEFLESMMFFCIKGNHALFLQSRSLRAESFEEHMQWLLEHSGTLTDKQSVQLADQAFTNAADAIRRYGVKSVEIGMPLKSEPRDGGQPAMAAASKAVTKDFQVTPSIRNFFESVLGDKLDGVRLEDALDGRIDATVELRWAYSIEKKAQQTLDRLAVALRHVAKDQVQVHLNNGSKVEGKELHLVRKVSVHTRDKIVEQSTLFRDMRQQMLDLVESGAVA